MKKSAQTVIRPDACYTIAAANGRVLEVADFNTENGASVRLWSYEGQPWQQWFFVEAGENEYRIKNRFTGWEKFARRLADQKYRFPASRTAPGYTSGRPRPAQASAGKSWMPAAAR